MNFTINPYRTIKTICELWKKKKKNAEPRAEQTFMRNKVLMDTYCTNSVFDIVNIIQSQFHAHIVCHTECLITKKNEEKKTWKQKIQLRTKTHIFIYKCHIVVKINGFKRQYSYRTIILHIHSTSTIHHIYGDGLILTSNRSIQKMSTKHSDYRRRLRKNNKNYIVIEHKLHLLV